MNNQGIIDTTKVGVVSWQNEQAIHSVSDDGVATLILDVTTRAVAADGSRVDLVTVDQLEDPAPPSAGNVISVALRLGPSGATFDPPLLLSIDYTKVELPPNTDTSKLRIYLLVGNEWQAIDSTVDTDKGIVYAPIEHFSDYALIAPVHSTKWWPFGLGGIGLLGLLLVYSRRWGIVVAAEQRAAPLGDSSRSFTLQARNFRGRPLKPGTDVTVRLSGSSPTGHLDAAGDGTFAAQELSLVLPSATGVQTFYYRDSAPGAVVFTARTDYRLSKWVRSRWPARSKSTIGPRAPEGRLTKGRS